MWVLVALGCVVLVIVAVLSLPVDLNISLNPSQKPRLRVTFTWLFGLIKKETRGRARPPDGKKKPGVKRRRGRRGIKAGTLLELVRNKGLFKQLWLLATRLLRIPRISNASADLTIGLGDPADTALLFAIITPASLLLQIPFRDCIRLQPSHAVEPVLAGSLQAKVRVQPIKAVPPVIRFVFSIPAMVAAKRLVSGRWKRR